MKEKNNDEFSVEHVFPDAIGGTLIINNVCKCCNDYLGREVDCKLTDHFLTKLARYTYKIPNKQGEIPNPFGLGRKKAHKKKLIFVLIKKQVSL